MLAAGFTPEPAPPAPPGGGGSRPDGGRPLRAWLVALYLALAAAQTLVHDRLVDAPLEQRREELHRQTLEGRAPAPTQYRILMPSLAGTLMRLGLGFRPAYLVLRFAFTFLAALALHRFLAIWLTVEISALGVACWFGVLPITYFHYFLQPGDLPNLLLYLLAFLALHRGRDLWLVPILLAAMLNRESGILIVAAYLLVRWGERNRTGVILRAGALAALGLGVWVALRVLLGRRELASEAGYLAANLADPAAWGYAAVLFNAWGVLAWTGWRRQPRLLRRLSLFVPLYALVHASLAILREPRIWLPVFPPLLAMGLLRVFGGPGLAGEAEAPFRRRDAVAYLLLVAAFAALVTLFQSGYERHYVEPSARQAERLLERAEIHRQRGDVRRAVEDLERARALAPQRAEPWCRLGSAYAHALADRERAIAAWRRCLEIEPAWRDRRRIELELRKLEAAR